jgi:hypothetical protein
MSKYAPLSQRLQGHGENEWRASFADVEQVLGFPLPKSARSGGKWWANDAEKSHSRAWAAHGWEVADLDHAAETVVFRRSAASAAVIQKVAGLKPLADSVPVEAPESPAHALVAQAAGTPDAEEPADPAPSRRLPKVPAGALIAGAVAVVAGIGAFVFRRFRR